MYYNNDNIFVFFGVSVLIYLIIYVIRDANKEGLHIELTRRENEKNRLAKEKSDKLAKENEIQRKIDNKKRLDEDIVEKFDNQGINMFFLT